MQNVAGFARTLDEVQSQPFLHDPAILTGSAPLRHSEDGLSHVAEGEGDSLPGGVPTLSPRLAQVAALVADGCGNKEIARHLGLTEATIKVHVKAALRIAGCRNRTQLAIWWIEGGRASVGAPPHPRHVVPVDWHNPDNIALLRQLVAGRFNRIVISNAFAGGASDDVLTVALALLAPVDHPASS